ncbi:hypothetical protein EJB05_01807, partial [Eragrostis curvula]
MLGTTKTVGRANWNHQRIVYLIGLLKEYDVPRYRTNNAWSKEAWNSIVAQFNLKFSTTYTLFQVKQKEQDMKKEYRVVKDLCGESGFGWDSDRKMVTAPDSVWESLGARKNKESLLRWRDKSYPYYDDLFALYNGRYAEGRSCHGMDHYANKGKQSVDVGVSDSPPLQVPDLHLHSPAPTQPAPCASFLNTELQESGTRDETDWFNTDGLINSVLKKMIPYFLSLPKEHMHYIPLLADKRRPKRQKTNITTSTEDFHERYLRLKKEEIDRFAAIEEKKMEDPHSIKNCVTILEGMGNLLQIEDMIKAADVFKDNPANREVFLSFSSDAVRLGWLLKQL